MALIPCKGNTFCTLVRFLLYSWIASAGHTELYCEVRVVSTEIILLYHFQLLASCM